MMSMQSRTKKSTLVLLCCLALAGLASCSGGGGSGGSGGNRPVMQIDPADFAEAIDITGRQSVEGQIDSPDDSVLYSFRIDEPSVMTFRVSSDFEITLYDSEGNVLQTSPVGEDGIPTVASVPRERIAPIVLIGAAIGLRVGTYFVRVALTRAAAATARAAVQAGQVATRKLVLATAAVAYRVRQIGRIAELRIGINGLSEPYDLTQHFSVSEEAEVTWNIVTAYLDTKWGRLNLAINRNNGILRGSPIGRPACGNQRERSQRVRVQLSWSWRQLVLLSGETPIPFLVNRDTAPRRIQAGSWEITVTVPRGGSETISLTDYIEDPDSGRLTFTLGSSLGSVPSGLRVTRDGARWTIAAQEGATGGTITVTATDEDGECWEFPLQVNVNNSCLESYNFPRTRRELSVPEGGSRRFSLRDYVLWDVGSEPLTYTLCSMHPSLRITQHGSRLTIAAQGGAFRSWQTETSGYPFYVVASNQDNTITQPLRFSVIIFPSSSPRGCIQVSRDLCTGSSSQYTSSVRNTCNYPVYFTYTDVYPKGGRISNESIVEPFETEPDVSTKYCSDNTPITSITCEKWGNDLQGTCQ